MSVFDPIAEGESLNVRWAPADGVGLQTFRLRRANDGYLAMGVIVGEGDDGEPFGLDVLLTIDTSWTVRLAHIGSNDGRALLLEHDGEGTWTVNGEPAPQLQGCRDIDLSASPITNTPPVLRHDWTEGQSRDFTMAYIKAPELEVFADRQRYTFLGGHRFRYEEADGSFSDDITFDAHGLVADYPTLFHRA